MYHNKENTKSGFTLIELSIVIIIIGLLIGGIVLGQKLVFLSRMSMAQTLTNSSPVNGIEDLVVWLETTSKDSFDKAERVNNAFVTTWRDINPQTRKRNATQTGADSTKPNYVENGINGLPALEFDSSLDDFLDLSITNSDLRISPGDHEMFVVFYAPDVTSGGSSQNVITLTQTSGTSFGLVIEPTEITYGATFTAGQAISKSNIPSDKPNYLFNGRIENDVSYRKFNDSSEVSYSPDSLSTVTTHNIYIGRWSNPSPIDHFEGKIGEIIIFDRALSIFEREQIREYLSKKWKIKIE